MASAALLKQRRCHGRTAILVLAALVASLVVPTLARASVVNRAGNLITVTAGAGELNDVTVNEPTLSYMRIADLAGVSVTGGCIPLDATAADCGDPTTISRIVIQLGDGNDRVRPIDTTRVFDMEIDGAAGDDQIEGHTQNDVLRGGDGNDTIAGGNGQDQILGGGGNDVLSGNHGDDTLDGGPGRDSINGDGGPFIVEGNDTIEARDAEQDAVQCGLGADIVNADAIDVIATADCEQVNVAAAQPPGSPPATVPLRVSIVAPPTFRLSRLIAKGIGFRMSVSAPCTVNMGLLVRAPVARRLGLGNRIVLLDGGSVTLAQGGTYAASARPKRRFRAALARAGSVTAFLAVTCEDQGVTAVARKKIVFSR